MCPKEKRGGTLVESGGPRGHREERTARCGINTRPGLLLFVLLVHNREFLCYFSINPENVCWELFADESWSFMGFVYHQKIYIQFITSFKFHWLLLNVRFLKHQRSGFSFFSLNRAVTSECLSTFLFSPFSLVAYYCLSFPYFSSLLMCLMFSFYIFVFTFLFIFLNNVSFLLTVNNCCKVPLERLCRGEKAKSNH